MIKNHYDCLAVSSFAIVLEMFTRAYIGLGSNIGDLEANLFSAIEKIGDHPDLSIGEISSFITTKAVSDYPQPDYLNGVVSVTSLGSVRDLFDSLVTIENTMGRTGKGTGEPRVIDLDLLLFGDEVVAEDDLMVPHALMHERRFVLEPLLEIAPALVHPLLGVPFSDLLEMCD